jgi:hypothetical protein
MMSHYSVHSTQPRSNSSIPTSAKYWNVNIPDGEHTSTCPDFLLGQSERNVGILSSKQKDARLASWAGQAGVKEIVRTNRIDHFQRTPLELRRYIKYCYDLKAEYGSVLRFIQEKRLGWETTTASGDTPFTNPDDYKILFNDWPYAIEPDVSHLVVWTKFAIKDNPETGDMTEQSRGMVEEFVRRTFCDENKNGVNGILRDQVIWFKNWRGLKSVEALEHFHVMLFRAPKEFLAKITGGDQAMSEKLAS